MVKSLSSSFSSSSKIIGIGNAIVDILYVLKEAELVSFQKFCDENKVPFQRDQMQLIEMWQIEKCFGFFDKAEQNIVSGGSIANTMHSIALLGNGAEGATKSVAEFCGCANVGDRYGEKFAKDMEDAGCEFKVVNSKNVSHTSVSLIIVDESGGRTMLTCIDKNNNIESSKAEKASKDLGLLFGCNFNSGDIFYIEGYLLYNPSNFNALTAALPSILQKGVKVALSLSDAVCVDVNFDKMLTLISLGVSFIIGNEFEVAKLFFVSSVNNDYRKFLQKYESVTHLIETRNSMGCCVYSQKDAIECKPFVIVESPVDTTGAGDCFAAGFLFGLVNKMSEMECANFANLMAAECISKIGARISAKAAQDVKTRYDAIYNA